MAMREAEPELLFMARMHRDVFVWRLIYMSYAFARELQQMTLAGGAPVLHRELEIIAGWSMPTFTYIPGRQAKAQVGRELWEELLVSCLAGIDFRRREKGYDQAARAKVYIGAKRFTDVLSVELLDK